MKLGPMGSPRWPTEARPSAGRVTPAAGADASFTATWAALQPKAAEAGRPAAWQGVPAEIPAWQGSFQACLERAQAGLRAALTQLGIPAGTAFTVDADTPDGHIDVLGEFEGREALEACVNDQRELHDALGLAASNASFCRCVEIAQRGAAAARGDPAHADAYNAWIVAASQQAQAEHVLLRFEAGNLTAQVLGPDGLRPAMQGLPVPRLGGTGAAPDGSGRRGPAR